MSKKEQNAPKNTSIPLESDSVVYVVCPAHFKTGGTELLHQYVACAKRHGIDCRMAYVDATEEKNINPAFSKYIQSYCAFEDIEDEERNVVILPEIYTAFLSRFKKIKRVIWWESVDNYLVTASAVFNLKRILDNPKVNFLNAVRIIRRRSSGAPIRAIKKGAGWHFVQSRYAKDFLESHGITNNVFFVSDYINEEYLKDGVDYSEKEDLVCYNPAKGRRFTSKLLKRGKEITFVPLVGMTNEEVKKTLAKAKVYIDFGHHPGKDRFPREAASMGCCVITNKKGAALNEEDVPIGDRYKFNQKRRNIPLILSSIKRCLSSFDEETKMFEDYRKGIREEKAKFEDDVAACYKKQ